MLRKLMPAILPAALAFAVGAATYAKADQPKVPAQAAPMSPNMMQGGGMMGGGNMSGSGDMKGMGDMTARAI